MEDFFKQKSLWIFLTGFLLGGAIVFCFLSPAIEEWSKITPGQPIINVTSSPDSKTSQCDNLPLLPDNTKRRVTKIIDGDTVVIEGGYSVRLLGIDADERGHRCYEAASERLEELLLDKTVLLEMGEDDQDQYCRYLRYPILNGQNISLMMVQEGLAVARFYPGQERYREEIQKAEQEAKQEKIGCKWSR